MTPESVSNLTNALHWVIGGLLALAILFFILQFFLPGWRARRDLSAALHHLKRLRESGKLLNLDEVRDQVMTTPALRHCWDEYRDTLHGQKQPTPRGDMEVARWRATAMANGFFTEQTLVDAPLRTEFYKHLPGILTGLGIIGTFSGLIVGLQAFGQADLGNADAARNGLRALLQTVGSAFVVSGTAIALAMLVTTIEKGIVNRLYTVLEDLCGVVDSLFDSGAGEEYLQRLVEAAETSATQAMQMKESLVTDLKQVLTELTQQQISTMTSTTAQLGHSITSSLNDGLKEPLDRISQAVQTVGNSQGDAVNKLLTDVLSNFTSQMESMFGSQMRGMNEMLVQTANTIQAASKQFEQLAGQIQEAGSGAADAMARRIDDALQQMQARQSEANDQMRLFIDQLKDSVSRGQSESAELTLGMMKELSETSGALIRSLQEQAHASDQAHAERQATAARERTALLAKQEEHLLGLTSAVADAASAMRESIERLQTATNVNVERMGLGAERLLGASTQLGENLVKMKSASEGLGETGQQVAAAASTLSNAALTTQQALAEHRSVRDTIAQMVTDLRSTVENAKREASLTSELVGTLSSATEKLAAAQRAADEYLEGVTNVLGETHAAFASQMAITMREGNKTFHEELAQATGVLKGAIQELGDVLDNLPTPA
ncbi:anti-phage ZorAB system protein ZorA [Ramlibacter monticola]|uniref:Anti-phage defense ZorAB system ZorA n=1 Tax=Ramlibacter monticola TaxID=1926872 RepID=A0A936ZB16_9BURK|nr:anti-phage ZorAB system protein ZorA [Ramlibacter monticola]MBL0395302.1 anti-phage defense ZorAB system ZorA [Ramlibacter monticola]